MTRCGHRSVVVGGRTRAERETWRENSPAAPAALSQGLGGETDAILGDQACIGDQSREIGGDGVGTGGVGSVEVDRGRMAEKERKSR